MASARNVGHYTSVSIDIHDSESDVVLLNNPHLSLEKYGNQINISYDHQYQDYSLHLVMELMLLSVLSETLD
jgi:hypothetical protein